MPTTRQAYNNQLAQALAMLDGEMPEKGVWADLSWEQLKVSLKTRLQHPESLAQGRKSHLCGPAVPTHIAADLNPLHYVELAREIFTRGTVSGRPIDKRLLAAEAPVKNATDFAEQSDNANPLDWMMLSAIRNAYGRRSYDGGNGFRWDAINMPSEVRGWLVELAGFRRARTLGGPWGELFTDTNRRIDKINRVLSDPHRAVVLLINTKSLRQTQGHGLHWVRLLAPKDKSEPAIRPVGKDKLALTLFDHGKAVPYEVSRQDFGRRVLQVIVADPPRERRHRW